MIKILDNSKDLSVLANDNTNGLGQFQPNEAFVIQELNGIFEAEIKMLDTDKHFKDIQVNSILKINSGEVIGEQMFRVYYISKPINHLITLKCQHITYDLNKVAVMPFESTGSVATKNAMISNMVGTYPFTMTTDIENTTTVFKLDIPKSFRECLGGWKGSILDKFRCEYEFDNLNVGMKAHLGSDNGVRIAYGKNLTDLTQEENIENVYTSVLGYAIVDEVTYVGNVYHKIQSTYPKIKIVDFSEDYYYDGENDVVPTVEELTQKAQDYATRNDIEIPNVNIKISFVPLYQTEEYKNIAPLERVGLGDTVHVFFDKLGVEASSRVIKTIWDVNLNKYESVELGSTKANLSTIINDGLEQVKEDVINSLDIDTGFLENQLDQMGSLIINGLGLHRTIQPVVGGGYRIYLHNKETLAESDTQYVITSAGFLISQDYGQTWNSGWDSSGNAVMNSLSTITLNALEIYGSYIQGSTIVFGDPSDANSRYISAAPYSINDVGQGVSFDGTGTIRMQPQQQFLVNNLNANGDLFNQISIAENSMYLYNYNSYHNYVLANNIGLRARNSQNSLSLFNYLLDGSNSANYISMFAGTTTTGIELTNLNTNGDLTNQMMIGSDANGNGYFEIYNSSYNTSWYASYIKMGSNPPIMELYNRSDIYINSDGAVRMYSHNSQDITINSADDIHISYTDHLYIQGRTITFGSDGNLKWSTT